MDGSGGWSCEAYGEAGMAVGALCFLSGPGERLCGSPAVCHGQMTAESQAAYRLVSELAARGHPVGEDLAQVFGSPEQIFPDRSEPGRSEPE
jgi:hypothetical protein